MPDPFNILGLPRRFDLNADELQAKFIQASSHHHPDRHTDSVAQAEAAEKSAEINQAYAVLSDPESRADALLTLLGGPAKEDDKSLPPALLMEMMEVREELEQAIADNNKIELERLRGWASDQRHTHLTKIAELFDTPAPGSSPGSSPGGDANIIDESVARAIRLELNTLRYIQRMLEQMPG